MSKQKGVFKAGGLANEQERNVSNPYLNARRAWNVHTAGLMKSLQVWQVVAIGSLLIALAAVGGVISIGSQSKFIPLVFQQDANGNTLSVTRGDLVSEASLDDYRAAAAHFIESLRLVSADADLQKRQFFKCIPTSIIMMPHSQKYRNFTVVSKIPTLSIERRMKW